MKKTLYTLFILFSVTALRAQVDTVFYENFNTEPEFPWPTFPLGDDTTWVNVDADGLTPYDADQNHFNWFFTTEFGGEADSITGEYNGVMGSLSYMEGFAVGNRNWLIMPPIHIDDNTYTLHWKSAPLQLPRYMDGYSVYVSTTNNDIAGSENPFTDTLFRAASMEAITGDGESLDISNFSFTPGYIHGNNVSDWTYLELFTDGDSTLARGLLEPHSVTLSGYAGQTIYIAFVHDSDDDYYLSIDDVLVTSGVSSGTHQTNQPNLRFTTYPNPAQNYLDVLFRLPEPAQVAVRISDMSGRTVRTIAAEPAMAAGEYNFHYNIAALPTGNYTVSITANGYTQSRVFHKQ